jgi:hypothetical protein
MQFNSASSDKKASPVLVQIVVEPLAHDPSAEVDNIFRDMMEI